ncbi:protein pinocchio isoform X4 [Nasonia vitripennis]|uniref:Protein pinocchio n=1 Tax=Nasonia vitripennis TaxID=7425 RepID=A0A7M7HIC0_NASVI|nr:protein pinocchio isoform X4 [Nasonia vitripennis]
MELTEFEESVSFDLDDPDFAPPAVPRTTAHGVFRGMKFAAEIALNVNKFSSGANTVHGSNMSVTSVQNTTENLSRHGSNISLSCHSLCGSVDESLGSHPQYQDTILTIEELRAQLNSCFTCGVSWSEEHVSLDCSECGGYSLQRPCPLCDGRCHAVWKRDLTMSHASGKARWIGECALSCGPTLEESLVPALEKLRATS